MAEFRIHSIDTASREAQPALKQAKEKFGFVPNMLGAMAESPALVRGYLALTKEFEESSLSPQEQLVVLLAASFENKCHYCMPVYSAMAQMQKMPEKHIEALRRGQGLSDPKLEALRRLTKGIVASRGWPSEDDVKNFFDAGYSKAQLLDAILGVGLKTLSNYTNHIAETPLDDTFKAAEWSPGEAEVA